MSGLPLARQLGDVTAFEIAYAAHTASCTFLLDADGICRRVVPAGRGSSRREPGRSAARCVSAQYVASLDPSASGMLAEMPRIGSAMLFARVDERGRVSLVRTGPVTHFERHHEEDPFVETEKVTSRSVETSAPVLYESRRSSQFDEATEDEADLYANEGERTRPIETLDPAALDPASLNGFIGHPFDPVEEVEEEDEDDLRRTAEYESHKDMARSVRVADESGAEAEVISVAPPTVRKAPMVPNKWGSGESPQNTSDSFATRPRAAVAPRRTPPPAPPEQPNPTKPSVQPPPFAKPRPRETMSGSRPPVPPTQRIAVRGRDR